MSTRRTPGLSSLQTSRLSPSVYALHGATLRDQQSQSLSTQLSVFQSLLQNFAITHSKDIRANPAFRAEFARMCSAIGVDFLSSSYTRENSSNNKDGGGGIVGNFWSQMLGPSVNDFYFNLGIRIVSICRATRAENGGLISFADLRALLSNTTPTPTLASTSTSTPAPALGPALPPTQITDDDLTRTISALAPLGPGFTIMKLGHRNLLRSVPKELNTDQSTVLEAVQILGYITVSMLQVNLGWERARAVAVVEDLMADSLVWVDTQAGENEYWSPAFITGAGAGGGGGGGGGVQAG